MKQIASFFFSLFLCAGLSSCAIQTRSANDLPSAMQTVYIEASSPYDQLTTQLTRQLKALHINVVDSADKAPVTLRITQNDFTAEMPKLIASSSTFSYTYTLATKFELATKTNRIITKRSLSTSDSLIQNSQQMYTPNATTLIKRELTHTMTTLIYEQLTTENTRKSVARAIKDSQKSKKS